MHLTVALSWVRSPAAYPVRRADPQVHSHVDVLVGLLLNEVNIALQGGLELTCCCLRKLDKLSRSICIVLDNNGDCVSGGVFYAPGKAATADHNLLPEQG